MSDTPLSLLVLEAAGFDPLRAQEIEDKLGVHYWEWYMVYKRELNKIQRKKRSKAKR